MPVRPGKFQKGIGSAGRGKFAGGLCGEKFLVRAGVFFLGVVCLDVCRQTGSWALCLGVGFTCPGGFGGGWG